jgi:hypothetical protein
VNSGAGGLGPSGYLPTGPNDHRLVDVDGDGATEILTVGGRRVSTRWKLCATSDCDAGVERISSPLSHC